jgi:hypothetical protein
LHQLIANLLGQPVSQQKILLGGGTSQRAALSGAYSLWAYARAVGVVRQSHNMSLVALTTVMLRSLTVHAYSVELDP